MLSIKFNTHTRYIPSQPEAFTFIVMKIGRKMHLLRFRGEPAGHRKRWSTGYLCSR